MLKRADYKILAQEARPKAVTVMGAETIEVLERHFQKTDLTLNTLERQQYFYALLVLAAADSNNAAVETISEKARIDLLSADRLLVSAVNAASADWQDAHEDFLMERGIVRGLEAFHKARREEIGYRKTINTLMKTMPAESQKIVLAAIDASHFHKNKYDVTMKDRTLLYIAAQLLPDATKRAVTFVALRKEHTVAAFKIAVESSTYAIMKIAPVLGIDTDSLPPFYRLDPVPATVSRRQVKDANGHQFAADLRGDEDISLSAKMTAAAANSQSQSMDERAKLAETLDGMVLEDNLTELQKDIYLYAITLRHDGNLPTEAHIVSKFTGRSGPKGVHQHYLSLKDLRTWMPEIVRELRKVHDNPPMNPLVLNP